MEVKDQTAGSKATESCEECPWITVMSVDRGTVNWSAPEVLRGASDYTAGAYNMIVSQLLHFK
jgi:hypothetical protein